MRLTKKIRAIVDKIARLLFTLLTRLLGKYLYVYTCTLWVRGVVSSKWLLHGLLKISHKNLLKTNVETTADVCSNPEIENFDPS